MKHEVSLLHSEVPATCPYPEPDQSSPCTQTTSWWSILILSSHLRLGLPSGFPQVFPRKPCIHISSPPYVLHVQSIAFFSFWKNNNYEYLQPKYKTDFFAKRYYTGIKLNTDKYTHIGYYYVTSLLTLYVTPTCFNPERVIFREQNWYILAVSVRKMSH